jgi:hypothetical protein
MLIEFAPRPALPEDLMIRAGDKTIEIPGYTCVHIAALYAARRVSTVAVLHSLLGLSLGQAREVAERIAAKYGEA